jgi:hypothetical protein
VRNDLQQQNYLPSMIDGLYVEIALFRSFRERSPPIIIFWISFLSWNFDFVIVI